MVLHLFFSRSRVQEPPSLQPHPWCKPGNGFHIFFPQIQSLENNSIRQHLSSPLEDTYPFSSTDPHSGSRGASLAMASQKRQCSSHRNLYCSTRWWVPGFPNLLGNGKIFNGKYSILSWPLKDVWNPLRPWYCCCHTLSILELSIRVSKLTELPGVRNGTYIEWIDSPNAKCLRYIGDWLLKADVCWREVERVQAGWLLEWSTLSILVVEWGQFHYCGSRPKPLTILITTRDTSVLTAALLWICKGKRSDVSVICRQWQSHPMLGYLSWLGLEKEYSAHSYCRRRT